jgi:hypothetical protein
VLSTAAVWWSVIFGRVCVAVCVCVTYSSAHLIPPGWKLPLTPVGNSSLQFWLLHSTDINHSWPWIDRPCFQADMLQLSSLLDIRIYLAKSYASFLCKGIKQLSSF